MDLSDSGFGTQAGRLLTNVHAADRAKKPKNWACASRSCPKGHNFPSPSPRPGTRAQSEGEADRIWNPGKQEKDRRDAETRRYSGEWDSNEPLLKIATALRPGIESNHGSSPGGMTEKNLCRPAGTQRKRPHSPQGLKAWAMFVPSSSGPASSIRPPICDLRSPNSELPSAISSASSPSSIQHLFPRSPCHVLISVCHISGGDAGCWRARGSGGERSEPSGPEPTNSPEWLAWCTSDGVRRFNAKCGRRWL